MTAQKFLDVIESKRKGLAPPPMPKRAKRGRAAALAVLLSGCVAPSQPVLDYVGQHCADGYRSACDALPYWRSVVAAEHWQQAGDVLIGVLSVGVLAVDALAISKGHAPSPPPAP